MPYGPGHEMSKSVKRNLSYRKKGNRLFNKKDAFHSNKKETIEVKNFSQKEVDEFTERFKKEHALYKRKVILITIILCVLIFGTIGYLMNT